MTAFKQYYNENNDSEDELEEDAFAVYTEEDFDIDENDNMEEGFQRLVKKIVIRNGKKKKRWTTEIPNHKVIPDPDGGRPTVQKMAPDEIRQKKKSQKLGAIKRKAKKAQILIKRKISNLKRQIFGFKRKK